MHDDHSVTSLPITSTSVRMRLEDLLSDVLSGGQTGADRAALDRAIDAGLPHGGWCPLGRHAEDGPLPPQYRLRETEGSGARQRAKRNVRDSDGTLILNRGALDGGSRQTAIFAQRMGKPVFIVQLDRAPRVQAARRVLRWPHRHPIATLNVAGPRESKRPGIHSGSRDLLTALRAAAADDSDALHAA